MLSKGTWTLWGVPRTVGDAIGSYPNYSNPWSSFSRLNFSFQKLDFWAQEEDADICLYGHLHIPDAWKEGRTLF